MIFPFIHLIWNLEADKILAILQARTVCGCLGGKRFDYPRSTTDMEVLGSNHKGPKKREFAGVCARRARGNDGTCRHKPGVELAVGIPRERPADSGHDAGVDRLEDGFLVRL